MGSTGRSRGTGQAAVAICVLAGLIGLGAWAFSRTPSPRPQTLVNVVTDVSPTSTPESRCDDIHRVAADEMVRAGRADVRITLLATGRSGTAFEPVRLGSVERIVTGRIVEGARADLDANDRFLAQVDELCGRLPRHAESPIFKAVLVAVRSLTPDQCRVPGTTCKVVVRTDGIEEQDEILMQRLRGARGRVGKGASRGVPRINNETVHVSFCGLAERRTTRGGRRLPTLDAVENAFRSEFSAPDRVSFEPTCVAFHASR